MSKRDLYPTLSVGNLNEETRLKKAATLLIMNFISFCDGHTSLLEIAENLNLPIWKLYDVVDLLKSHSLIDEN